MGVYSHSDVRFSHTGRQQQAAKIVLPEYKPGIGSWILLLAALALVFFLGAAASIEATGIGRETLFFAVAVKIFSAIWGVISIVAIWAALWIYQLPVFVPLAAFFGGALTAAVLFFFLKGGFCRAADDFMMDGAACMFSLPALLVLGHTAEVTLASILFLCGLWGALFTLRNSRRPRRTF